MKTSEESAGRAYLVHRKWSDVHAAGLAPVTGGRKASLLSHCGCTLLWRSRCGLYSSAAKAVNYRFYGGRCRIRTCDFHRVKVALYR
jgi:hypothetical protein